MQETALEADLPEEVKTWILDNLGPGSLHRLSQGEWAAKLRRRLQENSIEDAVLGCAHELASIDHDIGNEYLSHFMIALHRLGRGVPGGVLRQLYDSADLVNSVAGDFWRELTSLEFRGRRQMLAYLSQKLRWKASDHARKISVRPEGKRAGSSQNQQDWLTLSQDGPATLIGNEEAKERCLLLLARLPKRDREMLMCALRGENARDIAATFGLSEAAARKALQRALEKLRRLAQRT